MKYDKILVSCHEGLHIISVKGSAPPISYWRGARMLLCAAEGAWIPAHEVPWAVPAAAGGGPIYTHPPPKIQR